jgi:two-component system sensor histidine kinase CiaH
MTGKSVTDFLKSTTFRLAASYLLIIMVLSIAFSGVIYQTSSHELGRQVPPTSFFDDRGGRGGNGRGLDYNQYFQDRIDEGRGALIGKLMILNLGALILGSALSFYLARRTLQPIENAMEAQSRFVTDASHELRTPLTSIMTTNEVALRKPKLNLSEAKDVIKSNTEDIQQLKDLTDGLLSLAKQDDNSLTLVPSSLQDIATESINRAIPAAQAKEISIQDEIADIQIMGDTQRLIQALVIVLDNAIKYSPKKSIIHLEGGSKHKQAYLSVRDEGKGISPVDLPHIFDRFYRAEASRNKADTNGYGIGLAIAKKVIKQHGGKITASSVPGQGATFLIEIPLASPDV